MDGWETEAKEQLELTVARLEAGRGEKNILVMGSNTTERDGFLRWCEDYSRDRGWICAAVVGGGQSNDLFSLEVTSAILAGVEHRVRLGSRLESMLAAAEELKGSAKMLSERTGAAVRSEWETDSASGMLVLSWLGDILEHAGVSATKDGTGVLLCVSDVHNLREDVLGSIVLSLHRAAQINIPVSFVGTGSKESYSKIVEVRGYANRMFHVYHAD